MPVRRARRRRLRVGTCLTLLTILALLVPTWAGAASQAAGPVMYPSGVGADLGATPATLGIRVRAGDNPDGLVTGTLQGRDYWKTNTAANTGSFYLDLDEEYVSGLATKDVTVSVTYYDTESGGLSLHYDAADNPDAAATDIPMTGTARWKTSTFSLSDGRFANRLNGADLRLGPAESDPTEDIIVSSIRVGSVGAAVDLGATPRERGIAPRAGDRAEGLIVGEQDGRTYWQTNRAAPAPATLYLYMNVADTYVYNTKNTVLVSIDYFDEGNGRLSLQYDSPGEELSDKFKNSEAFAYGDSRTWKTHTYALDDAVMTNRSNGSDFRITTGGGAVEVKVASVRVTVVAAELDTTQGLRNLIGEATRDHVAAREGTRDGQFPSGSKTTLRSAIDDAQAVVDTPSAGEERVKAALHTVFEALRDFRASKIDTNLARGATATASSGAPGAGPELAVDGDGDTAWTSGAGHSGEWLQVDLGKAQQVNDVRVSWAGAYSPDYTVQVSTDGQRYVTVGRSGTPGGNRVARTAFETSSARFVKVAFNGYAGQSDTFSVRELQVRNQPIVQPRPKLVKTAYPTDDAVVADFDVSVYGADRTGAKDATSAIQRALYDCYDAGGGTVWMPAGKYLVTDTLEVHAFCTLRGDRRDPDVGEGGYGTVVLADVPSGDDGPAVFRIGGSAGVMGITTYYPRQSATDPVPYNYTFEIPGGAWIGNENYMMATISDVTMLNSYRGIGISTMPNDRGTAPSSGQVHESSTIRNVKGTALYEGVRAYNGADVGTWENVTFNNAYWADAPSDYHPPRRATLDAWTRAHGTGFALGDLEWEQLYNLQASDYDVGIRIVPGQRISFAGSFLQTEIRRTNVALKVESFDSRWGLVFAAGRLEGSQYAIQNSSQGFVKLTGTQVRGATQGIVHVLDGQPPAYTQGPLPQPARAVLYDARAAPFRAPRGAGYLPAEDATAAIQAALDQAHRSGGGIVYLPAGWYRIQRHLRVPANVELRGASAVPNRDQLGASGGTVLMAYEGRATTAPDSAPALITLDGSRAGVRGLRIFYPENNPAAPDGLVAYPYAVRGNGPGVYAVNLGLPNAWNGIDLATHRNDRFVVRKVTGAFFDHAVTVGPSDRGRVEGLLSNGNAVTRVGYNLPNWAIERDIFSQVIDKYMRKRSALVTVTGASRLTVLNAFAYGFHDGLVVGSGEVTAFNLGTDNLGEDGRTVDVTSGKVSVTNLLRYNGATSNGPARLFNIMAINMQQNALTVAAEPARAGRISLVGNETEPGRYERGSQVSAVAEPTPGFEFVSWSADGEVVSRERSFTVTVTKDLALTATFAPRSRG
ncbi:glycosyl hydrolase family 28-related protein [Actinopolymorpha alba]|uniref:glycosyl hydrolase family 28-related protein n=1 Tax=Actinopolymorpha alba TaxID=533267 RepID=UPI00037136E0|nr:glycosyl hydrolase family 28-related protein [Actinopolymorpha alba]